MDPTGPYQVSRPILYLAEEGVLVTENVLGVTLQDKLLSNAKGFVPRSRLSDLVLDFCRAGEWLRVFHGQTEGYYPGSDLGLAPGPVKDLSRIIDQTHDRLCRTQGVGVGVMTSTEFEKFENFLKRQQDEVIHYKRPVCSVHGDFFAGNVMISNGAIIGMDFESSTWGDPWFDVSYFLFQLNTLSRKMFYSKSTIEQLSRCFLEGYGIGLSRSQFWSQMPGPRIILVSHLVSRLLSLQMSLEVSSIRAYLARNEIRRLREWLLNCLVEASEPTSP